MAGRQKKLCRSGVPMIAVMDIVSCHDSFIYLQFVPVPVSFLVQLVICEHRLYQGPDL
jgi:hypothetical protein